MKTWQVKAICPLGWSEADGDGMDVCAEEEIDVGMVVAKLKLGVAIGWVA